ncbi:ankyrin protein [Diaporthe amygdali]|uniref:ankyrin protein n=1 Tax=Phomopsis amygdali TaxID=1214568 RepID=UPI0022FE5BF0|nr:ankyrin protein [Diaporthe amygdali]KAJ0110278.1 ankyrin protein [Diaporthe amygdali]
MPGFYMQYLESLCERRGWEQPTYECYREPGGYTCLVLVNEREYQTDVAFESDELARENAAMRAFMVCRNFEVNGGMLARNGIVQGLPTNRFNRKDRKSSTRHMSTASTDPHSSHSDGRRSQRSGQDDPDDSGSEGSTTIPSSSGAFSTDIISSSSSVNSSQNDHDLDMSTSYDELKKSTTRPKVALMNHPGISTKPVSSREAAEAYRKSLEEYGQTSASPYDLTRALEAHNYNKTQWLLEKFFDQVAVQEYSWLAELVQLGFSPLEITDELLEKAIHGSWIHEPFDHPQSKPFVPDFHQNGCVHVEPLNRSLPYIGSSVDFVDSACDPNGRDFIISDPGDGVQDKTTLDSGSQGALDHMENPSTSELERRGLSLTARQRIEYLCGLGGVRPAADGSTNIELGSVSFDKSNSMASITLNGLEDNNAVLEVLKGLDMAAGELQRLGGCCNLFTILLDSGPGDYVKLRQVPFATIGKLRELVLNPDISSNFLRGDDFIFDLLGEAAFMRGYTHDVEFLPGTHWPVLAFGWLPRPAVDRKLDIPLTPGKDMLASPVDVLDTWGPGYMVASANDSNVLHSVFVGGGTITSTGTSPNSSTTSQLHWSRDVVSGSTTTSTFLRNAKGLIGTTIVENTACQSAAARLRDSLPMLEEIGTFPTYWELMERQLGIGVQGGQAAVAILQFNQTWVKMMGATKKSVMLSQRVIYISDLENMFGVQVSICTGIARRVRLRDLLADLLPAYVSGLVVEPLLWKDLVGKFNVLGALRESDFKKWLDSLDRACRVEFEGLVFAVLYLLRDTGIDRQGDQFVVACVQNNLPFQCFKIPCKNENYWARMLIDSEDNATFAYVTTQCLETAGLKCCRPSPSWSNSTALLGTAVSQDRVAAAYALAAAPGLSQWTLKENESYLIGRPDKVLEHLDRNHRLPISYLRCYAAFESERDRDSYEIVRAGRPRGYNSITEAQKWRHVYLILFPDTVDQHVSSPCYELKMANEQEPAQNLLTDYERFLQRELPPRVRGQLERRIEAELVPIEDRLRVQIVETVRDTQVELFRLFKFSAQNRATPLVTSHHDAVSHTDLGQPPQQDRESGSGWEYSVEDSVPLDGWSLENQVESLRPDPLLEWESFPGFDGQFYDLGQIVNGAEMFANSENGVNPATDDFTGNAGGSG